MSSIDLWILSSVTLQEHGSGEGEAVNLLRRLLDVEPDGASSNAPWRTPIRERKPRCGLRRRGGSYANCRHHDGVALLYEYPEWLWGYRGEQP